jgi:hypothetical protein
MKALPPAARSWPALLQLVFSQTFQMLSGTLFSSGTSLPVSNGRVLGERITFTVGGMLYEGRVDGGRMEGTSSAIAEMNENTGGTSATTWKAELR